MRKEIWKRAFRWFTHLQWQRLLDMLLDTGNKIGIAGAAIGIFRDDRNALEMSLIFIGVCCLLALILPRSPK